MSIVSSTTSANDLIALAADTSNSGRTRLLLQVSDILAEATQAFSAGESEHLVGITNRLARLVTNETRQHLAQRLNTALHAPAEVILRLAGDDISVARPVLTHSPVLSNSDLIGLAENQTQEHMLAISLRQSLHESVTEVLAELGNEAVLIALVGNLGAQLSRPTAAHLVGRSQTVEPLQAPLVERADIPTDLVFQMFWWADPIIRAKIIGLTEKMDPAEIESLLGGNVPASANDITRQEGNLSSAQEFVRDLGRNGNLSEETLVRLLRGGQVPEFVVALSHMSDLNLLTARRVLQDRDAESLALVCRASGFNKETFSSLESLIYNGKTRSGAQVKAQQAVFDKAAPDTASKTVMIWRHGPDANAPLGEWPPKGADLQSAQYINLSGQKLKELED